jgi:hypothetical protein
MGENVDINRFALTAVLTAAGAKRPSEYPDFETLNAMSDAALVAYAEGLLYSLEHSLQPRDAVAEGVRDGLREILRGNDWDVSSLKLKFTDERVA